MTYHVYNYLHNNILFNKIFCSFFSVQSECYQPTEEEQDVLRWNWYFITGRQYVEKLLSLPDLFCALDALVLFNLENQHLRIISRQFKRKQSFTYELLCKYLAVVKTNFEIWKNEKKDKDFNFSYSLFSFIMIRNLSY